MNHQNITCGISPPQRTRCRGLSTPVWLAGLALALLLAIIASCQLRCHIRGSDARLMELDRQAAPCRQKAEAAIPQAVADIAGIRSIGKLGCLLIWDKLCNSNHARDFLAARLAPFTDNCAEIARIYGLEISPHHFSRDIKEASFWHLSSMMYSAGGLGLEAALLKTTLHSMGRLATAVSTRTAASLGSGTACAIADGPLPVGDVVGVALALGGTALSLHGLHQAYVQLPVELTAALQQQLDEFHQLCRSQVKL